MAQDERSVLGIKKTMVGWISPWWWMALMYFVLYGIFLISLGFGLDTDAWLMAQTAEKLRMGDGYDPARSLGNPLYEFLIVPLQWNEQWTLSNATNLLIFCIIIWRIPTYFPEIEQRKVPAIRLLFLLFPLFLKNATSSIEFIPALWFLMEAIAAMKKNAVSISCIWTVAAIFCRLEFAIFLLAGQMSFWQKRLPAFFIILAAWAMFIFFVWNKNPVPHQDSWSSFYFHRLGALMVHGGTAFLVYPFLIIALINWQTAEFRYKNLALSNLILFLVFPFEWEYLLPFFLISLVALAHWGNDKQVLGFGILLQLLNFIHFQWDTRTNHLSLQLQLPHRERADAFSQYLWAQKYHPAQKTVYLSGATLFPFPVKRWEKIQDNRMFHRRGSHFYVAERLTQGELDSLQKSGWILKMNAPKP